MAASAEKDAVPTRDIRRGARCIRCRNPDFRAGIGTDWVAGGWDIEQTTVFAEKLEERGCDAIHVSSGGLHPAQNIQVEPTYQVPLARVVKSAVRMPVITVGLISGFEQAEAIVTTSDADLIELARTILYDPHWPRHAAAELGGHVRAPNQYLRCQPAIQRFVRK